MSVTWDIILLATRTLDSIGLELSQWVSFERVPWIDLVLRRNRLTEIELDEFDLQAFFPRGSW